MGINSLYSNQQMRDKPKLLATVRKEEKGWKPGARRAGARKTECERKTKRARWSGEEAEEEEEERKWDVGQSIVAVRNSDKDREERKRQNGKQ